jgi:hypothetical protein
MTQNDILAKVLPLRADLATNLLERETAIEMALLALQPVPATATISLHDLRAAQAEVQQLALADDTWEAIISIKHELETEGIAASDRRWKAWTSLVRAGLGSRARHRPRATTARC